MKTLKILGVHGLGDHRNSTWEEDWEKTLRIVFPGQANLKLEFDFLTYDPIFEDVELSVWETMQAVWKLARSGATTALGRRRSVLRVHVRDGGRVARGGADQLRSACRGDREEAGEAGVRAEAADSGGRPLLGVRAHGGVGLRKRR